MVRGGRPGWCYTPPVPKVSVTVITRNEAANIEAALSTVAWADETVVVDSGSTDDTVARAHACGAVVAVRSWEGFGAQKNHAASLARNDWVFSLDADERVSPRLAREIEATLEVEPPYRGYRVPRVAHHLGRWIRSTDWYPDPQLRLYDRRVARWTSRRVHESVVAEGPVGRLRQEIEHHPYRDIAHHLQTIDRYTTLAAEHLFESGQRAGAASLLLHPTFAFARNYLLRRGIRDGVPGLVVSAMNAYYVLLKNAKLWELQQRCS